jgi:hypothetical protein
LDVTIANLIDQMEDQWRECIRFGGMAPDFLLGGSLFVDTYRAAADNVVNRQVILGSAGGNRAAATIDAGTGAGTETGLFFKGRQIIWDPVFDVLDAEDSPSDQWTSRLYMLNTKFIKLRPIQGHWMVPRKPPRVYDRYVQYWATTAKAAMTTGKRNAHSLITVTGA